MSDGIAQTRLRLAVWIERILSLHTGLSPLQNPEPKARWPLAHVTLARLREDSKVEHILGYFML